MDIQLRPWNQKDLEDLHSFANHKLIANHLPDAFPHPYTLQDASDFIAFAQSTEKDLILAIESNYKAIGSIGLHFQKDIYCKNAEIGFWLAVPFWQRGIMSSAISKMVDIAFDTYPIERVYAKSFSTNLASQRVLEKNGFLLEAILKKVIFKNNSFQDEYIYSIHREQWQSRKI